MAFDGVTIAGVVSELKRELIGGRVYKIAQPEEDELLLTIKTADGSRKLFLSADASLPLIYLTEGNKTSPATAPNFCMLLRKHLQNGRITAITQPGLERIVRIEVEHLDEMGDLCKRVLIIEIMGKHSNIIFCDDRDRIIDSIKHVSAAVSSVREVLPGKQYFITDTQGKLDLFSTDYDTFLTTILAKPMPLFKAIYTSFTGISPVLAQELCHRAVLDGETPTAAYDEAALHKLFLCMEELADDIRRNRFAPCIAYDGQKPVEFCAIPLSIYNDTENYASMSMLLESYYAKKNALTRIRQKSADLRRIVQTALERNVKKYDLQLQQMKDTEKREKYRIYGELLTTYGYSASKGDSSIDVVNYYTNEPLTIPLDTTLTPMENAQHYFEKYNKMKRTYEALTELTESVKNEIEHLESIHTALNIAMLEEDLVEIKEELIESGYIRRHSLPDRGNGKNGKRPAKKPKITSKPFHYISSDGFHMYVGKNNYQNDELTFQFASGNDWWFHAKNMPGSHVIVKLGAATELPDTTFEEAARLAAYYSGGRDADKVEIDYIQKKHVKKPGGAKPGFVVYYTNYSMIVAGNADGIRLFEE